jgi:hypothetical protein
MEAFLINIPEVITDSLEHFKNMILPACQTVMEMISELNPDTKSLQPCLLWSYASSNL